MIRILTLAAAGTAALLAMPASAQPDDRKLVIYGNDRCPANTICVRAPESERYRIPKSIRETTSSGGDRWGGTAASLASAGSTIPGTCTATGPAGRSACWSQEMNAARAERKAKKEEDMYPQN